MTKELMQQATPAMLAMIPANPGCNGDEKMQSR
jgi:hypothetical protein